MNRSIRNRLVQIGMLAALAVTGAPLVLAHFPAAPQPVSPMGWENVAADPDDIVVDARDDLSLAQRDALNARYGLSLRLNSLQADEEELLISPVAADRQGAVLAALRKDPLVEAAEPAYQFTRLWTPNDPRFSEQWNLRMVDAEKAWNRKATGKGIVVAVIDTGVASEVDDRCYQARDFSGTSFTKGYDFVNNDDHPFDDHGHGTHVAGTIAETTDNGEGVAGLAYEATIMPLKVLDSWGSGTSADIADAIRYAADHGAKVINMSLGSPFPDRVIHLACQYAAKKGVVIVCAAGNSGGAVGYPAGFPECIAVSAVGPKGELSRYSSRGKEIAIAAPGGDKGANRDRDADGILQNTLLDGVRESDGYYSFEGTSMASPHVAAVAAMVMSRGVEDPAAVRQALLKGAVPKKPERHYGAGLLNADRAVGGAAAFQGGSLGTLFLTFGVGAGFLWLTGMRRGTGYFTRYLPWLGFVLGYHGPDLLFGWLGFASPFGIVFHSALIPLYLLWEAESKPLYRFVGAVALGAAIHLALDAARGIAPFPGVLPAHGIPWLWVNALVGLGVAFVAWGRCRE